MRVHLDDFQEHIQQVGLPPHHPGNDGHGRERGRGPW